MTRTAISPRLAMRTLFSTKHLSIPAGPAIITLARHRMVAAMWRWDLGRHRFDDHRLDQRLSARGRPAGAPEGWWPWPTTRVPAGAAWTAVGRPPRGALLASVLFRPDLRPAELHLCTAAMALAAAEACRRVAGGGSGVKWPTTCWSGEGKLAGVLAEADPRPGGPRGRWPWSWASGSTSPGPGPTGPGGTSPATLGRAGGRSTGEALLEPCSARPRRRDPWHRRAAGASWSTELRGRCVTLGSRVRVELAGDGASSVWRPHRRGRATWWWRRRGRPGPVIAPATSSTCARGEGPVRGE